MEYSSYLETKPGSERGFAAVFAVLFAMVGGYFLFTAGNATDFWAGSVAVAVGVTLAIIGAIRPIVLSPLNLAWFRFGNWLGKWISPIILGLVYFAVLAPLSLLAKLFGTDPLRLRSSNKRRESHWIERQKAR